MSAAAPLVPAAYTAPVDPPIRLTQPQGKRSGLVVSSPHSGAEYPADFRDMSRLDPVTLRKSEDAFVHELVNAAPSLGAPLLEALFPRAYCDPNREPYELDPAMFSDPLPGHVTTRSSKISAGLGTIAKVVAGGQEIYRDKLPFSEAERRVETLWRPYHGALRQLLDAAHDSAGAALLLDCHSMPSVGGANMPDHGQRRADMVLGDFHGVSCPGRLVDRVEAYLRERGFGVARNKPYAGGFITQHYTRREAGFHTLQIEINRDLYMDEQKIERNAGFERVRAAMTGLIELLAGSATPEFLSA
ncbi:MAG: N-formylglutamate amidohydrolase [Ferrovibrio sp.]|nr:N-formylglutamate amidohydrolase [Ferrovibrio sp.]